MLLFLSVRRSRWHERQRPRGRCDGGCSRLCGRRTRHPSAPRDTPSPSRRAATHPRHRCCPLRRACPIPPTSPPHPPLPGAVARSGQVDLLPDRIGQAALLDQADGRGRAGSGVERGEDRRGAGGGLHLSGALLVGPDGSVRTPVLPARRAPLYVTSSLLRSPIGKTRPNRRSHGICPSSGNSS